MNDILYWVILMKNTAFLFIFILLFALFAAGCGSSAPAAASASPAVNSSAKPTTSPIPSPSGSFAQKIFTLTELSKYNGKNGSATYVAIDGKVYDLSSIPQWKNGVHNGYTAGKDLSNEIKKAPHGNSVLQKLPIVGMLQN